MTILLTDFPPPHSPRKQVSSTKSHRTDGLAPKLLYCKAEEFFAMSDRSKTKATEERFTIALTERSLPKAEEALIRKVLEETDWNLKRSAMLLNIARGTLYSKMEKYNIRRPAMPALL